MIERSKIEELISLQIADSEVFVVDIQIKPGNLIQVFLDEPAGISLDTCVDFSRAIESGLDRDAEDFELQVSSPGLDQPFRVPAQYRKQIGRRVQVVTLTGEKLKGELTEASDNGFALMAEVKVKVAGSKSKKMEIVRKEFKYSDIKSTKVDLVF